MASILFKSGVVKIDIGDPESIIAVKSLLFIVPSIINGGVLSPSTFNTIFHFLLRMRRFLLLVPLHLIGEIACDLLPLYLDR